MVKLICSKEQALNNVEKSAKEATLKDFVKFVRQIEGGGKNEITQISPRWIWNKNIQANERR